MPRRRKDKPPAHPEQAAHVSEMLAELKEKCGVTAADLAKLVGSKPNTISQWRTGRRKMQFGTAQTIEKTVHDRYGLTFQAAWILGNDVPKNFRELVEHRRANDAATFSAIFSLAEAAGFHISAGTETPQTLGEALDSFSLVECGYMRTSDDNRKTYRYKAQDERAGRIFVSDGENSVSLDLDDFVELERQIAACVKTRLNLLLQRGKW